MIAQMTLRQIPDRVEQALRARAGKAGHSLNRTAIELLAEALRIKPSGPKMRDLSGLAGSWSREGAEEFERDTKIFEQIDKDIWNL